MFCYTLAILCKPHIMNTYYLKKNQFLGLLFILFISFTSIAQVGIGTTNPTETLDVAGNVKYSGSIMPNNQAGTAGQVLISAGVNNPNNWGADLTNVSYIERFVTSTGQDINANTNTSMTVTVSGLTTCYCNSQYSR